MIRLGGPIFGVKQDDPAAFARAHKEQGYRAAYCPGVKIGDKERIKAIRDAFEKEQVVIAEVGAWCNMLAADPATRKKNHQMICERLALADEIGALCCVDYLGSEVPGTNYGPHPDNFSAKGFDLCVQTVRSIIDAVKPTRAKFCLEMMQWCLPDSPEVCLDVLKAIDRKAFAVHLDPVNIVTSPRVYFNTANLLRRCFALLGEWIASCHAKDIIAREKGALHMDECRPGTGAFDYRTFLTELARLPHHPPLMIEHLPNAQEYAKARDYITALAKELNVW